MGAGRKKKTNPLPERVVRHPSVNCSVTARNLRTDELGGVILGCTRHTMNECLTNKIFGLPAFHILYIRKIKPGFTLFLFNYSDRKMHGIFEAASNGEMNINPYGWSEDGQELTKYPAQVRICVRKQCKSLLEDQYKPVLIDNYYTEHHFWFELDRTQTGNLVSLFESLHIDKPKLDSKHDNQVESERVSERNVPQLKQPNVAIMSRAKVPQYTSQWNVLQDVNSDAGENEEEEDDTHFSMGTNLKLGSSSATPFEKENEEEAVYQKLLQIVNEREKKDIPFKEENEEELHKPLQLVNERDEENSHWICRRNVSRWFRDIPLSGYVALVFVVLWLGLRLCSKE
ncbi:hypothetical protein C5167_025013 [Papaver somniferum]|uniref:DCD domain-containing protein n=2 Tax=Papaver somniferum TaxID=3469 RepID=A0A4Y7JT96_PAPSO|nr:uncharacterized protein LOC113278283 isoform X2 [Papaver somniferum]RZC63262.1 hypothetical protein C5167_025013 [Papaver somniferum]